MRKGQMEIMGLAVIIIIIIFGILLSLMFLRPKESTMESDITDSTLASNMLNMILKTELECMPINMKDLLKECNNGNQAKNYCGATKEYPCDVAKKIIGDDILKKTLDVWRKKYTFLVENVGGGTVMTISNTEDSAGKPTCMLGSRKYASIIAESFPIGGAGQRMEATLIICN